MRVTMKCAAVVLVAVGVGVAALPAFGGHSTFRAGIGKAPATQIYEIKAGTCGDF